MSDGTSDPWDLFQTAFQEITALESRPSILYHFTTVATLRKILEGKVLWASHAATLNDAKELVWCAERAKERVRSLSADGQLDSDLAADIVKFIGGAPLPLGAHSSLETSHLPCVVSLCATPSYSEQWLHYGRDGCGVAIGFDAEMLRPEHLELIEVDYSPPSQDQSIDRLLLVAQAALQAVSAGERTILAHKCAEWLKYLAPTMKHQSFVHETEWRFMSTQVLINGRTLLDDNQGSEVPSLIHSEPMSNQIACDPHYRRDSRARTGAPFVDVDVLVGHSHRPSQHRAFASCPAGPRRVPGRIRFVEDASQVQGFMASPATGRRAIPPVGHTTRSG